MGVNNFYQLALRYAKMKGCSIVKDAGAEDGWHYFAYYRLNLPKYGSLPSAIRIDADGKIEELRSFIMRQKVSNKAYALEHSQH